MSSPTGMVCLTPGRLRLQELRDHYTITRGGYVALEFVPITGSSEIVFSFLRRNER